MAMLGLAISGLGMIGEMKSKKKNAKIINSK